MPHRLKTVAHCFWDAIICTIYHDGIEHAGYLAFLGLLSFFPFLVLFVAVAGFLGESHLSQEFVSIILSTIPDHVATALKPRIDEIVSGPPQGLLTIAILGVIWTASSVVEGLRTILNRAYRVGTPPAYPLRRLLSIAQLLIATALVISIMLGLVFAPLMVEKLADLSGIHIAFSTQAYGAAVSVFVLFMIVASIYYILPNIRQRFVMTFPGAFSVVILWVVTARAFSAYLSQFDQVNLVYGSLGGIIAALLFFYLSAVILIFGAEFNYALEASQGHRMEEKERTAEGAQSAEDAPPEKSKP